MKTTTQIECPTELPNQNKPQHKGTWVIPKNLHTFQSAQVMEGLTLDSEDFSATLEQSLTANETLSSRQTWSRKLKKGGWMQLLFGRTLKTSHSQVFTDWWTSSLAESHANLSPLQVSEKPKEVKSFYTHHFLTELNLATQKLSSLKMSKDSSLPNSTPSSQEDSLTDMEQIQSCSTSSETWSAWGTQAISNSNSQAERVYPIQGGVYLLGRSEMISKLQTLRASSHSKTNSESSEPQKEREQSNGCGNQQDWSVSQNDERTVIPCYLTNPNGDVFIDCKIAEQLILANLHQNSFDANVKTPLVVEHEDSVSKDGVVVVPIETYLGGIELEMLEIQYQRTNKTERAGLLGNGVAPPMCTIAFEELLQSIVSGDYTTKYLPEGYADIDSFEQAIGSKKTFRRRSNPSQPKMKKQDTSTKNWPTPVHRDYKDACNRKVIISRVAVGKEPIIRSEMTLPSSCFTYFYKANNIQPTDPIKLDYAPLLVNVNQNWVETLMGLEVGWTDPLFCWGRDSKGNLIR